MPPHRLHEPVDVLAELPREAALAEPGRRADRHEPGASLTTGRVEQVLEQAQLVVPADERGLERVRPVATPHLGHDPHRPPGRDRCGLALERLLAGRLKEDRPGRCAKGRLAHEDGARRRGALESGGAVDKVACDQALVRRPEGHRRLAGQYSGSGVDPGPNGADRVDELEARLGRPARRRPRGPSVRPRPP